jgi:hypothetical protein
MPSQDCKADGVLEQSNFQRKICRGLWAVDATVVKVQTSPTRMRFAIGWKYCEHQWFQNVIKEVLCVVSVLFSHQIDDVEFIDSPNNSQREILGPDLLFHLLKDIISRYVPFRRMMKFHSEPTLVPSHKSLKLIFSWAWRMGNNSLQVSIRTYCKLAVNSWGNQWQFPYQAIPQWLKIIEWKAPRASTIE